MITPCIKKCKLERGICIGCKRSLKEIKEWSSYSEQKRKEIMDKLCMGKYCDYRE